MYAWRRKLDYAIILQPKYFTGENIPIYATCMYFFAHAQHSHKVSVMQQSDLCESTCMVV